MSKSPQFLTTAADAARILGLSRRQFDRLAKAGVLPQHGPRQFDLAAVVPAFCRYIEQGREGVRTLAEAKLRSEVEKGRKLAMANANKAGELVYASQVADALAELAVTLVGHLDAIPGRHADELATVTDRALMRDRLLAVVRDVRAAYAAAVERIADRLAAA